MRKHFLGCPLPKMETKMGNKELIESGSAVLGIEFGSTRIKAVLINEKYEPIAGGSYTWETPWITESGPIL